MAHQAFFRGAIIPIVYVGVGFVFGKLYGDYKDVNDTKDTKDTKDNIKIINKESQTIHHLYQPVQISNDSESRNVTYPNQQSKD